MAREDTRMDIARRRARPLAVPFTEAMEKEMRAAFLEIAEIHIRLRDEVTAGWKNRPTFTPIVVIGGKLKQMRLQLRVDGSERAVNNWWAVNTGRRGGVRIRSRAIKVGPKVKFGHVKVLGMLPMRPYTLHNYQSLVPLPPFSQRSPFAGGGRPGTYGQPKFFKFEVFQGAIEPRMYNERINDALNDHDRAVLFNAYRRVGRRMGLIRMR